MEETQTDSTATVAKAQDRITRWTQRLLDFSARNRLLNIPRVSRLVIRLLPASGAKLENRLAGEAPLLIRSLAEAKDDKTLDDLVAGRVRELDLADAVADELAHGRLCAPMPARELRRRLTELLHAARTEVEESGVSTLYLTVGELQWTDPAAGGKAYRAPILLIPVRLERASMAEGIRLYRRDEDTVVNVTLVEFLRTQFGLVPAGIDPLPTDESGVDVGAVLEAFRRAVAGREGWSVEEGLTLGCYCFGKFVMWREMTEHADELRAHPLVNHLIGGGGLFDDGVEVFPPGEIARHLDPAALYCPVSYDSSQLAAVLYSALGKTFVLHGPPGTGKSQTITNIIAHNLALGRRVLFVSEKKAALDVVKDRLDRIGLSPFCLELHSNKTEKGRFYAQLKEALEVPETALPGEWDETVDEFDSCRAALNAYVAELHRAYPNGLTAYACFTRLIESGAAGRRELIDCDCLTQARADYLEMRQLALDLTDGFRAVPEGALGALPRMRADAWSPVLERGLGEAVGRLAGAADRAAAAVAQVTAALGAAAKDGLPRRTAARLVEAQRNRRTRRAAPGDYDLEAADRIGPDRLADLDGRLRANAKAFCLLRWFRNRALLREFAVLARPGAELKPDRLLADAEWLRDYARDGRALAEAAGLPPDAAAELPAPLLAAADALDAVWPDLDASYGEVHRLVRDEDLSDLAGLGDACRACLDALPGLRAAMRYRRDEDSARDRGLAGFVRFLADHDDGALDAAALFDDAYAAKMLDAILAVSPTLAEFTGMDRERRIARFRELNARYAELSRRMVFARLAAHLPRRRGGPCPDGSELGRIRRECEKKTRQKAVRQILSECTTLVPALKPCFLMSPLSVAQYLPVGGEPFDLVVFDEASQIPVWDAIGVIARGRQLIVVGDPKQMPPTNFFQKGDGGDEDDDEEAEVIADQESILDECLVAGVHSTYLSWHYRSRHESLIAFSNAHYYDNRLCTFPAAADSPRLGVRFHFVEGGRFARTGRGPRVNEQEAKALVDYVCDTVLKPGYRRRSIGVVTFSMTQQKLIRTMLEERRAENAELERLLPESGEGGYFVKNLENVQGDESDVILFSVGYAPDENGRFTMNFGPLNLAGGERRLNVAVTRAREQVVVFSSIHASEIDAGEGGRTQAVGAGHLKAFLDYAENGLRGAEPRSGDDAAADGRFADAVAAFLRANGYAVDRDVGCSEDRIDLAVRDPDDPSRYLVGVECDGPRYAARPTAQDRDVNRAGVLAGLGWRTCRVWSVDWSLDRDRAGARLLDLIREAREPAEPEERPEQPVAAAPAAKPVPRPAPRKPAAYRVSKLGAVRSSARFYEPAAREQIAKAMAKVIAEEGPICADLLLRRVGRAWGITRRTARAQQVFDMSMPGGRVATSHPSGPVYWPPETDPAGWRGYRVPSADPETKRAVDEIPPEELADAMREILADCGACPDDVLARETLRVFGLGALTEKARARLDYARGLLAKEGACAS